MARRKGQSILEYVLLFTVITLAVAYGVKMVIQPKIESQLDTAGDAVEKGTDELSSQLGLGAEQE